MRLPLSRLPSLGFVAVCATYLCAAIFFSFGFQAPDLDRVWTLHHLLKTGKVERLAPIDRRILDRSMIRHPALARDLLDGAEIGILSAHTGGWIETRTATLLRTGKSAAWGAVVLDVQTPRDLLPIRATLSGPGWREERKIATHGRIEIRFPGPARAPEIVELTLEGRGIDSDPSVLGIRVGFEAAP